MDWVEDAGGEGDAEKVVAEGPDEVEADAPPGEGRAWVNP